MLRDIEDSDRKVDVGLSVVLSALELHNITGRGPKAGFLAAGRVVPSIPVLFFLPTYAFMLS